MKSLTVSVGALFISFIAALARADSAPAPLSDRIPGDAILYAAWAGSDALAEKYDASHLKNIVDASDMPKLFSEFAPQLIERVATQSPQAADALRQVLAIGAPIWKHPTAIYFGGIDWNGPQPQPRLSILCNAGPDAPALVDRVSQLLTRLPKDQGQLPLAKVYGSLAVVSFGTAAQIDAQFAQAPADSLSKAGKFIAGLDQVQHEPALIEYADTQALVKLINDFVQRINEPTTTAKWQSARDALALDGVNDAIFTTGFDGRDWAGQAFISTTESNAGILAFLHGSPLSKELLDAVPQSADRMIAAKFNLDGFIGHVREIIAQIIPDAAGQVDDAIAKANEAAGLDIRRDFLAMLGDEWAVYSDNAVGGPGLLGSVIVNHLHDSQAADKAMINLAKKANAVMEQLITQPPFKVEFYDSVVNHVTVHYFAIPFITPCWAINDGNLYLGLYPQVVSAAVDQVTRKSPSILTRPEFVTLMKRMGEHPASSVSFCDLPAVAPSGYTDLLAISRLYLGMADIIGAHPPTTVIPRLSKITPELAPSGSISWSDSSGFYARSVSPFPGSDILGGSVAGVGALMAESSLTMSILLPSLNKARETANRAKCASNERQIGLALMLYSNDNKQKFPDDLGTLIKVVDISGGIFLCPTSESGLPDNYAAMTPDDRAKWVNENSDYVYVGKGLMQNKVEANHIIMYEKDNAHNGEGMNLLYGDGHVEFQMMQAAKKAIQDQQGGI